jgi:hypothetical protein
MTVADDPVDTTQARSGRARPPRARPGLGISLRVHGRERSGNRVVYLVTPDGTGSRKAVAESVLLQRWRHRASPTHTYSGSRLPPHLWRAVATAFPRPASRWWEATESDLRERIATLRASRPDQARSLPGPSVLRALFEACGPERLDRLIARHTAPERSDRFGTPDLFLCARNRRTGRLTAARFVEVKKPGEAVSTDQLEESEFLRVIGLRADLVRLVEARASATRASSPRRAEVLHGRKTNQRHGR